MYLYESLKTLFGNRGDRKTSLNGKEVIIIDKDKERAVYVEVPEQYFGITASDVDTFLTYIKDFGALYEGGQHPVMDELLICTAKGIEATPKRVRLTENIKIEQKSFLDLELTPSIEIIRWLQSGKMNQREFQQLLITAQGQHDAPDLAAILQVFSGTVQIDYTNSSSTERDYAFVYTEKDVAGQASIPRQITVNCPVVNGFAGTAEFVFDIVLIRPKADNEKIMFRLELVGADFETRYRVECLKAVTAELIVPALEISSGFMHKIKQPKRVVEAAVWEKSGTKMFVNDL